MVTMITIGIDVGKFNHCACVFDNQSGELLVEPFFFKNNLEGFNVLFGSIKPYKSSLVGLEDTGHYGDNLILHLLENKYNVGLINPLTTEHKRKSKLKSAKNDKKDSILIAQTLLYKDEYRLVTLKHYKLRELKKLTRHHHDLKEEINAAKNRLQKSIDLVFPEYNKLFNSKYGKVYNALLKQFPSAKVIANTDIRTLRKVFNYKGKGNRIKLTPEHLKLVAKNSVGEESYASIIQIKHTIAIIEMLEDQVIEVDKKIEELSSQLNSPITSIPGIAIFSGMSILSEYGDISRFDSPAKLISYAGVDPYVVESGTYKAPVTAITKKGSPYLRKTLYQIALPVINNNPVFHKYYTLKIKQGKSYRCALGHVVRKLLRIIHHLVTNDLQFDVNHLR